MINEKVLRDVLISLATHSLAQYETHAAMVQEIMALRQAIRELDPEFEATFLQKQTALAAEPSTTTIRLTAEAGLGELIRKAKVETVC